MNRSKLIFGAALVLLAGFIFLQVTGTPEDTRFSAASPVDNKSGSLSSFFLSATSCGTDDFDKCLTYNYEYGDAEVQPFLYYDTLDVIDRSGDTLIVEQGESIDYRCTGTKAWLQEGTSGPDIDYRSDGVFTDYQEVSREGVLSLSDYDVSNGFRLICGDYDYDNGFWAANAVWFEYTDPIKVAEDSDGDGLYDYEDSCSNQGDRGFGLKDNGCPIVDTDGDGVPDPNDDCPTEGGEGFGVDDSGCPIGDSDGDGVPNPDDEAPQTPGSNSDGSPTVLESIVQIFVSGWMQGEPLL